MRIKTDGAVLWGVCCVALVAAIAFHIATPVAMPIGGTILALCGTVATVTTLGTAATTAVTIGISAGGVGALNALRNKYVIVENDEKHILLKRKKMLQIKKGTEILELLDFDFRLFKTCGCEKRNNNPKEREKHRRIYMCMVPEGVDDWILRNGIIG